MKIISLFSGAGGLDLGLIQAGNEVIWANDIDKDAVATYRENIGDHIVCEQGESDSEYQCERSGCCMDSMFQMSGAGVGIVSGRLR